MNGETVNFFSQVKLFNYFFFFENIKLTECYVPSILFIHKNKLGIHILYHQLGFKILARVNNLIILAPFFVRIWLNVRIFIVLQDVYLGLTA